MDFAGVAHKGLGSTRVSGSQLFAPVQHWCCRGTVGRETQHLNVPRKSRLRTGRRNKCSGDPIPLKEDPRLPGKVYPLRNSSNSFNWNLDLAVRHMTSSGHAQLVIKCACVCVALLEMDIVVFGYYEGACDDPGTMIIP